MEDTGLIFDQLFTLYGLELEPINDSNDFLIELVELSNLGIQRGDKSSDFYNKTTKLLEYVLRTETSNLALLLTDTLINIQIYAKFYLTDNATNTRQLCDLILIQFPELKIEIYYNTMKLLNCFDGSIGKNNINSILKPRIKKMDINIYECLNLALSLELLHTYIILNLDEFKTLFIDIITDWDKYDMQVKEDFFEKLLWYSFTIDHEEFLKELVTNYSTLIKSVSWGIRFYQFIIKKLSENGQIDLEKIDRLINRFNKMNSYSTIEKQLITKNILHKIKNKKSELEKPLLQKKSKEKQIIKNIKGLSPVNLPTGVRLEDINQNILIHLAVYENEHMTKIMKVIHVNALTDFKKTEVYVTKPELKKIEEEAKPGYIHVIDNKKAKQKNNIKTIGTESNLFTWPSTDLIGTGFDSEKDSNGLKEMSVLRQMGYQITNSTREMRWKILHQAVPVIGLKKVAYTIARNVKLRKGQKNGNKKFSYAISEWEHDLQRLKENFYKKDFKWPKI